MHEPPGPEATLMSRVAQEERLEFPSVPSMKRFWTNMQYPWPIASADMRLQEALDIALDYLEFTRQAYPFSEVERACAYVILSAWKGGVRHRIRLANYAIVAIEQRSQKQEVRLNVLGDLALPLGLGR